MLIRLIAASAARLRRSLRARPRQAQEQSFAAFQAELWPDAQAKGITRATFDLAMRASRPIRA